MSDTDNTPAAAVRDARGQRLKPGDRVAAPRVGGVILEMIESVTDDGMVSFVSGRRELASEVAVYTGVAPDAAPDAV